LILLAFVGCTVAVMAQPSNATIYTISLPFEVAEKAERLAA
jgi:hypothetical protein